MRQDSSASSPRMNSMGRERVETSLARAAERGHLADGAAPALERLTVSTEAVTLNDAVDHEPSDSVVDSRPLAGGSLDVMLPELVFAKRFRS